MKNLISPLLLLFVSPLFAADSTVTVTHRDGTTHTFVIPADMESSYDLLRVSRVQREPPNPQTPQVPGRVIKEERNFGELLEAVTLETYERLIQHPQFQPATVKADVDAAMAALAAKVEKAKMDAKSGMRPKEK